MIGCRSAVLCRWCRVDGVVTDPIDSNRLGKTLALLQQATGGEELAALAAVRRILDAGGLSLSDLVPVNSITGTRGDDRTSCRPRSSPFAFKEDFDDFMERKVPGYRARMAAKQAEIARQNAAFRQSVIAKYGSEAAALCPTPLEQAINDACKPLIRVRAGYPDDLDGCNPFRFGILPARVVAVLKAAVPMPRTLQKAASEVAFWKERDNEIQSIMEGCPIEQRLSLACEARRRMVMDALRYDIRAVSTADAIFRVEFLLNSGMHNTGKELQPALDDLRALAAGEEKRQAMVQKHSSATSSVSARRSEVIRLLSHPATATLADREIARQVGVSPQTVGNLRRKLATSG